MKLCEKCSKKVDLQAHAKTPYKCKECKEPKVLGISKKPKICPSCAVKLNKCMFCEADLS